MYNIEQHYSYTKKKIVLCFLQSHSLYKAYINLHTVQNFIMFYKTFICKVILCTWVSENFAAIFVLIYNNDK